MLLVLEYLSISLSFWNWKLHEIPRCSTNVSFSWAWRKEIQLEMHENSEVIVVSGPWPLLCLVIFQRAALLYNSLYCLLLEFALNLQPVRHAENHSFAFSSFFICLYTNRRNVVNELWPGCVRNIQHYFFKILLAFLIQLNVLEDFCCDFM